MSSPLFPINLALSEIVSAFVAQRPQLLFDNGGRHVGSFSSKCGDGEFERIELAITLPVGGPVRRRVQVLLMVRQHMRRWRSTLRIGQRSYQYRRCRSLI